MSTLAVAYTLTFFFLAVALAGLLDRLINRPAHPSRTWTLDDLVSKRPKSDDEALWAKEYQEGPR